MELRRKESETIYINKLFIILDLLKNKTSSTLKIGLFIKCYHNLTDNSSSDR